MPEDKTTDSRIPLLLLTCSRKHWRLLTTIVRFTVLLEIFEISRSLLIFLAHLKFESEEVLSVSEKRQRGWTW